MRGVCYAYNEGIQRRQSGDGTVADLIPARAFCNQRLMSVQCCGLGLLSGKGRLAECILAGMGIDYIAALLFSPSETSAS